MDDSLQVKFAEYIQVTAATIEAARRELDQFRKQASVSQAVADLIPSVVEALKEHDRIPANLEKEAAKALSSHVETLNMLIKTANPALVVSTPARMGDVIAPKTATARTDNAPARGVPIYLGGKSTGGMPSDEVWERALAG